MYHTRSKTYDMGILEASNSHMPQCPSDVFFSVSYETRQLTQLSILKEWSEENTQEQQKTHVKKKHVFNV